MQAWISLMRPLRQGVGGTGISGMSMPEALLQRIFSNAPCSPTADDSLPR